MKDAELKNDSCFIFHRFGKWEAVDIDVIYKGLQCVAKGQRKVCKKCGYIVEVRL